MTGGDQSGIRSILDRQEIQDQLMRYCRGVDRRDEDLLRSVFREGAINDNGVPAPATQLIGTVISSPPVTRMHFVGNVLMELEGDRAFVETYFIAYSTHPEESQTFTRIRGGRWLDRFERDDSGWKIAHRRVVDEWSRLDEVKETPTVGRHRGESGPADAVYRMRELLTGPGSAAEHQKGGVVA
jgi:hypothetical protein